MKLVKLLDFILIFLAIIICLILIIFLKKFNSLGITTVSQEANERRTVSAELAIRVYEYDEYGDPKKPINEAEILIIDNCGNLIDSLITDSSGEVSKVITTSIDKKYWANKTNEHEPRGTVTALVGKKGYRYTLVFEVPISNNSAGQPIYLKPFVVGQRNGPYIMLGNNHRLEIISFIEKYMKYFKNGQQIEY